MDQFSNKLNSINKKKIKEFLLSLKSPAYESTLLKLAFPDMDILNASALTLYQNHFVLFHLLYLLQNYFYPHNKYLHIHFMRTFLIDYPGENQCRFYEETFNRFCLAECPNHKSYCDFHLKIVGENKIEELSSKYFYLDHNNYYSLDEKTAASFINGAWEILTHYKSYRKSFEVLDLPETSDLKIIKKKFRYLAKRYHPDLRNGSPEKFYEINRAYRLLMTLIPKMNLNQTLPTG